jgi:hypothetical protein
MDSRFRKEITTEMKGKRRASQMYEQHINRKKKGNSYRTSKRFFECLLKACQQPRLRD